MKNLKSDGAINEEIPNEILGIVASTESQVTSSTKEAADFTNRTFQTIGIAKDDTTLQLEIVRFADKKPWDLVQIVFKNCVYQDRPRPTMLKIVEQILRGEVALQKTLLRKNPKWIVKDDDGSVLAMPTEVWD